MKNLLFSTLLLGLSLSSIWLTACKKDKTDDGPKVFLPTEIAYGKSYTDWTKFWVQQWFNEDCNNKPWEHPENVLFYTDGPVYILAGIAELGGSANITIPQDKALLFPLVNTWWNVCPGELEQAQINENNPNLTAKEYVERGVNEGMAAANFTKLSVTIDGVEVSDMSSYKFISGVFDVTGIPCDVCITGNPQPFATGGYYVIVKPLSKGQHTIHYHMEAPGWGGAVQDATSNIAVQ